ncbi:MAG: flagellar biosynthesis anti-sigma factor FlgM [Hydrogenothermaceae bacterium]|nr:flagellar biosynthesis anti-sigma factor FlgM [Hydrogenothermaceae bacterium]
MEKKFDNTEISETLKKLEEECNLDKERLNRLKELIEAGEYNVSIEEVVAKMLKYLKEKG